MIKTSNTPQDIATAMAELADGVVLRHGQTQELWMAKQDGAGRVKIIDIYTGRNMAVTGKGHPGNYPVQSLQAMMENNVLVFCWTVSEAKQWD